MLFNDDEQIVIQIAQPAAIDRPEEKITRNRFHRPEAGLEEGPFKVLIQLIGGGTSLVRPGLDLIAVLDISSSMDDDKKIETMKMATSFVIKKLRQSDRLSVVTFSSGSTKLCPLRQMTENAKQEIDGMVQALSTDEGTNIPEGLTTALNILDGRRLKTDRKPAIFLMSDGDASEEKVTTIPFPSDVTVHTFGFGVDCDAEIMDGIARRSMGGMFWQAPVDTLTTAFAQCLAGLLTVAAEELELVLIPQGGSTIIEVSAGSYTTRTNAAGTVSVEFGDLYVNEDRKTIVELLLPRIERDTTNAPILRYTYQTKDLNGGAIPRTATIKRSGNARAEEIEKIEEEESRLRTMRYMKDASEMVRKKDMRSAEEKVKEGMDKLNNETANAMTRMLKAEMGQFLGVIQTVETQKARAFVLAALTSHNRQRFATRGDNDDIRLFATPRMEEYLQQANDFMNNPEKPVPSAEEDVKKEVAKDPLASFAGALSEYLQTAIEALQGMESLIRTNA